MLSDEETGRMRREYDEAKRELVAAVQQAEDLGDLLIQLGTAFKQAKGTAFKDSKVEFLKAEAEKLPTREYAIGVAQKIRNAIYLEHERRNVLSQNGIPIPG